MNNDTRKKILIIDGHGIAYRAFYAIKATLTAPDGTPTNAITGFMNMLTMAQDKIKPVCSVAVFDAPAPTFRHELLPEYKANRKPSSDEFRIQIPVLQNLLRTLGCPVLSIAGVEADDVIGSLAIVSARAGYQAVILSSDKDLMQVVSGSDIGDNGADIIMLRPLKSGVSQAELFNAVDFEREHGYPASSVPDFLALTGDSSDNVPGVPGVGKKTATDLISQWRTLEAIYDALDKQSKAVQKKLSSVDRETVLKTRELLRLKLDIPVDLVECLNFKPDTVAAIALAEKLGLARLLQRLKSPDSSASEDHGDSSGTATNIVTEVTKTKVRVRSSTSGVTAKATGVKTDKKSREEALAAEIRRDDPVWSEFELVSVTRFAELITLTPTTVAVALAPSASNNSPTEIIMSTSTGESEEQQAQLALAFAPQGNSLDENKFQIAVMLQSDDRDKCYYAECSVDELEKFLRERCAEGQKLELLTQDYKTLLKLNVAGFGGEKLTGLNVVWDLRTAYYLLHPDITEKAFPLLIPDKIPPAPALFALKEKLDGQFEQIGQRKDRERQDALHELMTTLDLPLLTVLDRMERHGVRLDYEKFTALQSELEEHIAKLEHELQEINKSSGGVGELNLNSPAQVSALLFDRLGLPPDDNKRGKLGYSTSADVLEHLARLASSGLLPEVIPGASKVPGLILEYRELSKMLSGFVIPFQRAASRDGDGIIHTTFEAAFTGTGRLSSRDPNLQNIPAFGTWAERIKTGLVPTGGSNNVFIAADYSQIELRVLADMSREQRLIDAFKNGHDIHRETASWVFDIAPDFVTPELRRTAKMINFGLLYGMSSFGLAERLDIPRSEASDIIKRYFAALPNMKNFLDDIVKQARDNGFTRTLDGRIRSIYDLKAHMSVIGNAALDRVLINTPIQGTAADIARRAVLEFDRAYANDPDVNLFLQVHDSLVCECSESRADEVGTRLQEIMRDAAKKTLSFVDVETELKISNSLALI